MIKAKSEYKDKTNVSSNQYLHINSCGLQKLIKETTILRTQGRVDFQIMYIVSGRCELENDGIEYDLGTGDAVIYKPNQRQLYKFSPNTSSYFIHFSGIGAEEVMKASGLWSSFIISPGLTSEICDIFKAIVRESITKKFPHTIMCEGKLIELIAVLARAINTNDNMNEIQRGPVYDIMVDMNTNYHLNISVNELAARCGFSKSHFDHLFKEVAGLSPHRYLSKIRLERAVYLLCNSYFNISEIAEMVGYSDSLYFSRVFKKAYGKSPSEYRRSQVGKQAVDFTKTAE